MFQHMRGDDVIERVVVKRQQTGVAIVVGAHRFVAELREAIDVDGIDAADGMRACADFRANTACVIERGEPVFGAGFVRALE